MDIKKVILEEYNLESLVNTNKRRGTIDAKKLFVRFQRDYNYRTYWDIADELGLTHASIINLYNKSDWLVKYDDKAKRVWSTLTNKPKCDKVLNRMSSLLEGVDDPEIYEYVLEKIEILIRTKKIVGWSRSL